jgi:hypothetical protein
VDGDRLGVVVHAMNVTAREGERVPGAVLANPRRAVDDERFSVTRSSRTALPPQDPSWSW